MTSTASRIPQAADNVDPAELAKFQSLASRWWDPESEFRPLHQINPLRLDWIEQQLGSLAGLDVIDVGCGGGILSESMAWRGARVTGIDLAAKSLKIAQLHALETQTELRYELISAEAMAQREPASRDVVTCMEMLEHVPDPDAIVRACAALARPSGLVFFSTLHRNVKSFLHAIVGAEHLLRLLPRGTHEFDRFIRPSELLASARAAGLDALAMTGLTYNPLTQQYRLIDDVSVNYMVALRKAA